MARLLILAAVLSSGCGAATVSAYGAVNAACVAEQQAIVDDASPATAETSEADFEATVRVCRRIKTRIKEAYGDGAD